MKNKKWFTLIELLAVLIIVVLLYFIFVRPTLNRFDSLKQCNQINIENDKKNCYRENGFHID